MNMTAYGILKGSATSILGLCCFVCLDVDVLATNLGDVVSCGTCDVLTACGRCGVLVSLLDDDDILVGGGFDTGLADIAGVAGVTIGVIIGTAGVITGVTAGFPGISFDFDDCGACSSIFLLNCGPIAGTSGSGCELVTCGADGVDIGSTGITVGATGITGGDTVFGFGCFAAFGGGLAPGIYVVFGTGFGIHRFRSGDNVSPGSIPGSLGRWWY